MPLSIHRATSAHLPAMLAIYTPYVEQTTVSFEVTPPGAAEFARRFANNTAQFPWLVCQKDGEVAGYAYATRFGARAGYDCSAESSVYIAQNQQGNGAGHLLYSALAELLAAQGYHNLYARIVVPNAQSEGFHTACGFTKEAVLQNIGCKFGCFLSIAYYKRQLLPYAQNPRAPLPFPALAAQQVEAILRHSAGEKGCE